MARFWVYIDSKVEGPLEVPALRKVQGFNLLSQVCAEGEQTWRMADEVIEIKSYFLAPPRAGAITFEAGNTALLVEPDPELQVETLEEKPGAVPLTVIDPKEIKETKDAKAPGPGGLRVSCEVCGYKNPRDVKDCMKCGTPVKTATADTKAGGAEAMELAAPKTDLASLVGAAGVVPPPVEASDAITLVQAPAIEIPIARIAVVTAILASVTAIGIFGYRAWQKKHHKPVKRVVVTKIVTPTPAKASVRVSPGNNAKRTTPHSRSTTTRRTRPVAAAALPGIAEGTPVSRPVADDRSTYRTIPQVSAMKQRDSSPIDSSYATKRREDSSLWTERDEQSIRLAQKQRIYGGMRTVQRNADILMQILRDREYMSGFESGKRPLLFNQMTWSASPKLGPTYEVQLVFSGGKEADNSARKPLRFAFDVDLERGSVKPGGDDQIRANTLHAFFNEGRIPPEERRATAKDIEQLVLAAQPGGSPLALDTVMRNFVSTYNPEAAGRVAEAFNLDLVKKKLRHDPRLVGEVKASSADPALLDLMAPKPQAGADLPKGETVKFEKMEPAKKAKSGASSASGPIEFRMERAEGRGRTLQLRVPSSAAATRLWEVLTGYDRLKQFVPDMLMSEREGQDGRAIIVRTQSLSRFMIFVFKVDLHLRVIEHPSQMTLEFERIAGEFESFRGAVQVVTDPMSKQSSIQFRATFVPKKRAMDWVLRDACRNFFVPLFDAIRKQAETN